MGIIFVFGASKLSRGGLVPSILNDNIRIVIVRSGLQGEDGLVYKVYRNGKHIYNEVVISDNAFLELGIPLKQGADKNVFVISEESFRQYVKKEKTINAISVCREGIFSYVSDMVLEDVEAFVVSFDNNASLAIVADAKSEKISVRKGVAHYVVTDVNVNKDLKRIDVVADESAPMFIFPPESEDYFETVRKEGVCVFTKDREEFKLYVLCKVLFINGFHTLMAMYAYLFEGLNSRVAESSFIRLSFFKDIVREARKVLAQSIKKREDDIPVDYVYVWSDLHKRFVDYIEAHDQETVGRAAGFDESSKEKVCGHYEYFKCIDERLDAFMITYLSFNPDIERNNEKDPNKRCE